MNYNDPLPKLGEKVKTKAELEKEAGPRKASESDWKSYGETPGVQINSFTGQLRTNFALPEGMKVPKKKTYAEKKIKVKGSTSTKHPGFVGDLFVDGVDTHNFIKECEKLKTLVDTFLDPTFEIPDTGGWRTDTPKKPGAYYATDLSSLSQIKESGFSFIRYWNGSA